MTSRIGRRLDRDHEVEVAELVHRARQVGSAGGHADQPRIRAQALHAPAQEGGLRLGHVRPDLDHRRAGPAPTCPRGRASRALPAAAPFHSATKRLPMYPQVLDPHLAATRSRTR